MSFCNSRGRLVFGIFVCFVCNKEALFRIYDRQQTLANFLQKLVDIGNIVLSVLYFLVNITGILIYWIYHTIAKAAEL